MASGRDGGLHGNTEGGLSAHIRLWEMTLDEYIQVAVVQQAEEWPFQLQGEQVNVQSIESKAKLSSAKACTRMLWHGQAM